MGGFAVLISGLALALAACDGSASPSEAPATPSRSAPVTPSQSARAGTSASLAFCAGRTWPPYPVGGLAGVVARSVDRATIQITNRTGRNIYYRVSGWEPDQFETCRALGEIEVVRGPLTPGATERVVVDPRWQQAGVPVTVAVWDRACGEACAREPIGGLVVSLSPVEPAAS